MIVDVSVINNFSFLYMGLYELSLLSGGFFQQLLLKIQNDIHQYLQPSLHIQESLK